MKPVISNPFYISVVAASILGLAACSQRAAQPQPEMSAANMTLGDRLSSVRTAIACLPDESALIAAHRGVSENWDLPENSVSGLQRLIDENYLVAEVDVASTKDGTLFLFHDGVWEETSTGQGPVAASTREDLDKILLKSRKGTLASERPLTLDAALDLSKDKLFLEIDFKSSASEADVVNAIKAKEMGDQVILIAYTSEQAAELQALAPNMVLSAPGRDNGRGLNPGNTLLWMGQDIAGVTAPTNTLGHIGMVGHASELSTPGPLKRGKLLVTDFPDEFPPILGLTNESLSAYKSCLAETKPSES